MRAHENRKTSFELKNQDYFRVLDCYWHLFPIRLGPYMFKYTQWVGVFCVVNQLNLIWKICQIAKSRRRTSLTNDRHNESMGSCIFHTIDKTGKFRAAPYVEMRMLSAQCNFWTAVWSASFENCICGIHSKSD